MNSKKELTLVSTYLSYLDTVPNTKRKGLAEWLVSELLDRLSTCTDENTEFDVLHGFRDDLEYLIYSNPDDPRNGWLTKSLAELHRIEIFQSRQRT